MKLTNKGVQRGKVESQGTCPTKVDIFKWLLRNGVDIANIESSEAKKEKERKESRESCQQGAGWKSLDKLDK